MDAQRGPALRDRIAPIVLLAQNETGYNNLMWLSSNAYLECDAEPHVTLAQLAAHADGLICLTGGALGAGWLSAASGAARCGPGAAARTGGDVPATAVC